MGGYIIYRNQAAAAYSSLYFFIFLSLQFSNIKNFCHTFSGTVRHRRLKIGTHMDSGQVYRVDQNQAAALICPCISSFFFLSNCQTLKFFLTLFSGTVRPKLFKLGSLVDNGWMYYVPESGCSAYSSLYFFIFLSLQFSNIQNFRHTFSGTVRHRRLKLGTHMDSGLMYRVYQNGAAAAYLSLFLFLHFSFSPSIKH